jgi:xanthine dehydrogenase accessory factor
MDLDIFKAVVERPERLALATSIDVKGSSPRHPGAKLLLGEGGLRLGTVGGGRGEALGLDACRRCLATGVPELVRAEMLGTSAAGPDMICGGIHTILVELVDPAPYRLVLDRLERGKRTLLAKRLGPGPTLAVAVYDGDGRLLLGTPGPPDPVEAIQVLEGGLPRWDEAAGRYLEPVLPMERLLILGGGHVGRALALAALPLGFQVTVVDDRPEILAEGGYPAEIRTQLGDYPEAIAAFPCDRSTYAVVVTRSHALDLACLRALVGRDCRYTGFMGSARKTTLLLDQLRQDGHTPAQVERLWGPIGLDIGAETPAELAVAILGEIIAVRRNTAARLAAERPARRAARG